MRLPFVALVVSGLLLAGCIVQPTKQTPGDVRNLVVDQIGLNGKVGARLLWDDFPRDSDGSFDVYRDNVKIATVTAPTRSYFDTGLIPDRAYSYQVLATTRDGQQGALSAPVSFTLTQTLRAVQDLPLGRGFANLSVIGVSAGLTWSSLSVVVNGASLPLDDIAYGSLRRAWTHTDPGDDLVDLHEQIQLYAPGEVKRNSTVDVKLGEKMLVHAPLMGRADLNLTLTPTRNVSVGLEAVLVKSVRWFDQGRDVTSQNSASVARWSDLLVSVNGTALRYDPSLAVGTWTHDAPQDDILRAGEIVQFHADPKLLHGGAVITLRDAIEGGVAFVLVTH